MSLPFHADPHSGLQLLCRQFPSFPASFRQPRSLLHGSSTGMALLPGSRSSPAREGFMGGSGAAASRCSPRGPKQQQTSGIRDRDFSPGTGRNEKGNPAIGHHRGGGRRSCKKYSVKPSLSKGPHPIYFPITALFWGRKQTLEYAHSWLIIGNTLSGMTEVQHGIPLTHSFPLVWHFLLSHPHSPLQLCPVLCISPSQWQP